jgi:hypothetical protein
MNLILEPTGKHLYLELLFPLPDRADYLEPFVIYIDDAYPGPYRVCLNRAPLESGGNGQYQKRQQARGDYKNGIPSGLFEMTGKEK